MTISRAWLVPGVAVALFATPLAHANVFVEPGTELTEFGSTDDTRDLELGDMDGDGDLDLVVGAWSGSFRLWENDGSGAFSDTGFNPSGAFFTNDIELFDADGDSDLDVLQVRGGGQDSQLWLNDGSGGLTNAGETLPTGTWAAIGDFNGDSSPDIVFGDGTVHLNDGTGQFSEEVDLAFNGNVAAADLDGDGNIDILQATGTGSRVYFNDGGTPLSFTSGPSQGLTGLRSLELVDTNGDGDLDAVTDTGIYTGDGTGTFTQAQLWPVPTGSAIMAVTAGDVDGDSTPDAVLGYRDNSFNGWPNQVWLNGAPFTDSGARLGNGDSGSLALGDVDGDGDADLVVGNSGGDPVVLYRNDPAASGARAIPVFHPLMLVLSALLLLSLGWLKARWPAKPK